MEADLWGTLLVILIKLEVQAENASFEQSTTEHSKGSISMLYIVQERRDSILVILQERQK